MNTTSSLARRALLLVLLFTVLALNGCIAKGKYLELEGLFSSTKDSMQAEIDALEGQVGSLQGDLGTARAEIQTLKDALAEEQARVKALERERASLLKDAIKTKASVEQMEAALRELERRKAAADARVAAFQDMLSRFQKLIDAGTLRVKIVDGRMVVELATDILFDSGSARLSDGGKAALTEVAAVLESIPSRRYQVEGHTDNDPIKTAQYPSNWELASGRALSVVKTMVAAGLSTDRVSAASYAEFKPAVSNETSEGKANNRRIEIVVVPDLSDLPGFDELSTVGK